MRSLTFIVGLVLAVGAFAALLVVGTILNPPPHQVVVALEDIPAYSTLNSAALAVDAQTMSSKVADGLVMRDELDQYLGGFTVQNIRAGEPLRKSAIVIADHPLGGEHTALMLDDPDSVAMVIPADPKTVPDQIEAGDFVDLVLSLTPGSINANNQETFGEAQATLSPLSSVATARTATPVLRSVFTDTVLPADAMNLPVAKVTLQKVPVLAVRRERIANPDFTVGPSTGDAQAAAPAYVPGDIQAVLVRVPRESVELLTFAMDNGRLHVSLLSPRLALSDSNEPTQGVSWNDVILWMTLERRRANGEVVSVAAGTVTPTLAPTLTPTTRPTRVAISTPAANPTSPAPSLPAPQLDATASALISNLGCILLPLGAGILLVLGAFVFIRRARA